MPPPSVHLPCVLLLVGLFCMDLAPARNIHQGPRSIDVEGRVPVSIIADRLVVSCDLSTPYRRIPANLLVEFEAPHGLVLHNRAAAPLRCENSDGTTIPIRIHLPDFDLEVERRELGNEEFMEEFTKYHSEELGENSLVGSIGYEVLREHRITFQLASRVLEFAPLGESPTEPVRTERQSDGSWVLPLNEHAGMLWMGVTLADGTPFAIAVGCSYYDTRVDQIICQQRSAPAGNLGPLHLGGIDLSKFVALRPEPLALVNPDTPIGVMGIGLLKHLTVTVDRRALTAQVRVSREPDFPLSDRAFFEARVTEEADELEGFLEAHETERLAHEAAELLLTWRFDEVAPAEQISSAIGWIANTMPEDLVTTRMLDLMVELSDEGRMDEVLTAGALAVKSGRKDRYPNAVHRVHGRMGRERLARFEGDEAWRHLLSASFGLPEDGPINLDLGRYYEGEGRLRRAFSRYLQAVLSPESGPDALEAMARVQPLLDTDEPFGVEVVERMIAGKVRNFGSATRFQSNDEKPVRRTVLVEFFTNSWLGDENRGAIGGAMAFEGLADHYLGGEAIFLSHHLPNPRVDPLCTSLAERRAGRARVPGPWVHVVDGVRMGPGAGKWRDAEVIYEKNRGIILERLSQATDWSLSVEAVLEEGTLSGMLECMGPSEYDRALVIVLAERGVLFPGKTGVIVHRHLARAELTPSGGLDWDPVDGFQEVPFQISLGDLKADQVAYLDDLAAAGVGATSRVSTGIDGNQVTIVAWAENVLTGEVLEATKFDLGLPNEESDQ